MGLPEPESAPMPSPARTTTRLPAVKATFVAPVWMIVLVKPAVITWPVRTNPPALLDMLKVSAASPFVLVGNRPVIQLASVEAVHVHWVELAVTLMVNAVPPATGAVICVVSKANAHSAIPKIGTKAISRKAVFAGALVIAATATADGFPL